MAKPKNLTEAGGFAAGAGAAGRQPPRADAGGRMAEVGDADQAAPNAAQAQGAAAARGRQPDPERRARILKAAAELFMAQGFAHTSMDQIAEAAAVSKQTVYAHFQSKEALYRAVIAHKIAEYFPDFAILDRRQADAEEALARFGVQFLSLVLSDDSIAMLRRLAESAEREPHLVRLFEEEGPERIVESLCGFCAAACCAAAHDRLAARALADLLISLLLGPYLLHRLLGLIEMPDRGELARHARLSARQALALARAGLLDAPGAGAAAGS